MVLCRRADIVVHHVHQINELDFLERYAFALAGCNKGVNAATQLDLFPIKEEEQLPCIGHGIHFFLRPDIAANDLWQRRIGTGNGHRRSCNNTSDTATVLSGRVRLRARTDDLIDEVDDAFRIGSAVR